MPKHIVCLESACLKCLFPEWYQRYNQLQATDFQDTVTCAHVGVDARGRYYSDPQNPLSGPLNVHFSSQIRQKEGISPDSRD